MRCLLQVASLALLLTPYTISSPIPTAATLQAALSNAGITAMNDKQNATNDNIPTGSLPRPSKRDPEAAPEPIAMPDPEPEPNPRSATITQAEDNSGVTDTTNRLNNATGIPEGSLSGSGSGSHWQEITRRDTVPIQQAAAEAGINELTPNKTTIAPNPADGGIREIDAESTQSIS